ncbi:MAG: 4'-phosphopantetheinyl transferase superfamily protein [Bacteroidales bacterium]|nr:4'-phosphopantetheinyl transferase superfamily protein [Bacteroidales bacterium]
MIYLNEHIDDLDIESALAEVSPQRRERVLRLRSDKNKRRSLAVYLLLKEGLQQEYGIIDNPVFEFSPEGKPALAGYPDIFFSLSHAGNVALCAIGQQPVGADVEVLRNIRPELISYTMNEAEQAWIHAQPEVPMAFLHLWTRKEAVLKLTGSGLRSDMTTVLSDEKQYRIETVLQKDYVYSIAWWKDRV